MDIQIHYFSGTGNSKNVAQWFKDKAKEINNSVDLIDISHSERKNIEIPKENALVTFISPTHGFNYPPIMMYYIFRFPKSRNNRVVLINTRAGMKLHKWFVPGLSGISLLLAAFVLFFKGYKIIGMKSIDLPSNWISLHPGLKESVILSIYERCKRKTDVFTLKIISGKKVYHALYDIIQDLAIAPISILYFFIGRFVIAKSFYATNKCNRCDLCITNCPVNAIKIVDNRPYWTYDCESCMKCMNSCSQRAIETGHGYIAAILIFINIFVLNYFWNFYSSYNLFLKDHVIFSWIIEIVITLFLLSIGYRIIHYLIKISIFRQFITYTSFTFYSFWRRYKSLKFVRINKRNN